MRDDYKLIYLESTSHPLAITPQAYEQIATIAKAHLICTHCLNGYTQDNPQVAENVCLACFTKWRQRNNQTSLTFVGEVPSEYAQRYGYKVFKFLDSQGYVYLRNSQQKHNDSMEQEIHVTLLHYGFIVPERYTLKSGTMVDLTVHSWRVIYGDFRSWPVVLATYREYYGDQNDTAFLLYRDREPLEISKRRNPTRQWYQESKAELEATYTERRGYIVGTDVDGEPHTAYHLYDSHMYPGIVARAKKEYDQKQASTLYS